LNALLSLAVLRAGNLTGSLPFHLISEGVNMVETHRANIVRKLKVHSLGGLMRYALRNQVIKA
jgi:DNA-binding CsgD family transcriptional regulator